MNTTLRNILIGLGIILAVLSIWYFIHIVAYILISAVLALIGQPVVELLGNVRYRQIKIPKAIRALLTLLLMWTIAGLFLRIFIPIIAREVQNLSELDPQLILDSFAEPVKRLEAIIEKYSMRGTEHFTIENFITEKAIKIFNVSFLTNTLSTFAGILGNAFIAFFSISFMTFFFLRDENLFAEAILSVVPDKYVDSFQHAMSSSRHLLMRYFIGVLFQITGIFIMVTIGLTLIGVGFYHSLMIALIAASVNFVPYIGPLIGSTVGILLGITTHLELDFYTHIMPLVGWMVLVFTIVHLIDNILCQPLIFSNSVNAHPLEIFILLLIAGSLAGIAGMMLAIPAYTIIRVFAKEFFIKFKVVKKLTKNIS
jgi:predicted PurR-regulated permease PerM